MTSDSDYYNPFQPGEDIRRRRPGYSTSDPYPYIDYKNPNPALSAEALRAAFEGRRPTFPAADSFVAWSTYLEDNVDHEGSYGGPFTLKKPQSVPSVNAAIHESDVSVLQDAYGYVYEYLREFYEKDAPWGTHDDDVLDALERAINRVKIVTGYEEVGSNDES